MGEVFEGMTLTPSQPRPNPPRDMPIISFSPPGPRQPLPPAADMRSTPALNVSYAGAFARPPPIRPPPPKPQVRKNPAPSRLLSRIKELEKQHAEQLREKDKVIHIQR